MPDNLENLLEAVKDESINKILSTFKPESSLKANSEKIAAFSSKQLASTVDYLSSMNQFPTAVTKLNRKKHNRLKLDIAYEISNFCFEIMPATCKKCSATYIPSDQLDPVTETVHCIICDKSAHRQCYSTQALDVVNGIVFLCTDCLKSITSSNLETIKLIVSATTKTDPKKKVEPEAVETVESDGEMSAAEEEEEEEEDKIEDKQKPRINKNICKKYMLGICQFGGAGRGCPNKHPRHCRRWCSYGDSRWGCKSGVECKYAHPVICNDSENFQKCMDLSCSKIHLKGTIRYADGEGPREYQRSDFHNRNRFQQEKFNGRRNAQSEGSYSKQFRGRGNINSYNQQHRNREMNSHHNQQYQNRPLNSQYNMQNSQSNVNQAKSKEENRPSSQIITNSFLEKCLEDVQEKLTKQLTKQLEENMSNLCRKLFASQAQVQPPVVAYKPYQTNHANSQPSFMMGPPY